MVVLLLATALPALAGEIATTQGQACGCGLARVTDVKIVRASGSVQIQIAADRPLHTRTRRLSDPERFLIDLPDALFAGDDRNLEVGSDDITSIRITPLYQQEGPVTRIIVDLAAPRQFEVAAAGNTLMLKLVHTDSDGLADRVAHASSPVQSSPAEDAITPPITPLAAERRDSLAHGSAGESEITISSTSGAAPLALAEVPDKREPQPAVIAAQIADNNPPALVAAVAVEEPAADAAASDALVFGTGVTGSAQDPVLGADEHVLGPSKQDKKNKAPKPEGEGRVPHVFHLSGAAIGGYYQSDNKAAYVSHEASPIGSLHLDASGYLFHPGFLTFDVKPQGTLGRESSENVFPDGRGVAATTTFLGGSSTPLTVSYNRLNRMLVTFGPLDRLAGLEANTFQNSLSANWALRFKRMPEIILNFSKYSDSYEPLADMAPATANAARLGSIEMREKVVGWNLESRYKLERSSQDLINIFDPTQAPYLYTRNDREARASADRNFGEWLSVAFVAGATRSQNLVQGRPFDQSYRYISGNSLIKPTRKLVLAVHGGITNNVVGATLERITSATVSPADLPSLMVPSSARLQLINYSVSAQYALTKHLQLQGDAVRETTQPQDASAIVTPESSLTSGQAGISYSRRFRFVQFQSHYAANVGNFLYGGNGSSRSSGHKADLGAMVGSQRTLELTAAIQGGMQDVTGNTYMRDRSWGGNLTLARTFHEHWKLQATYNRARDRYAFLSQQFSSDGNGFSVLLSNPRVDFSASHNIRDGLTFQADPRLQYVSSVQAGMLSGAFPGAVVAPSGADWSSAAISIHPVGKFRARGMWLRSRQQLQGALTNRYIEWEASAGYQFRSLSIDAGYIFHDQNFGLDIFQRNRIFFRVVREFTIF